MRGRWTQLAAGEDRALLNLPFSIVSPGKYYKVALIAGGEKVASDKLLPAKGKARTNLDRRSIRYVAFRA